MKTYLEKHKIASLVILVIIILTLSILFVPQFNPVLKTIQNLVIPEDSPFYDDYVPQSDEEEPEQTSTGGSSEEEQEETPANDTIEYLSSKTYRTCVHTLIIQKCKDYLITTEDTLTYEQGPGYFKCYNQFGDDTETPLEITINAPNRIFYNRCGYMLKPTLKEKCLKNMYVEMCMENDLEYTEYNTALGTLICTDDGFYTNEDYDIHEKFMELEVTQEMIENRCGNI